MICRRCGDELTCIAQAEQSGPWRWVDTEYFISCHGPWPHEPDLDDAKRQLVKALLS